MAEITGPKIGENYDKYVGGIALCCAPTPDDAAASVSYPGRPNSNCMTGQALLFDGGPIYR